MHGIQYGVFVGWSSPSIVLLTSDQSPLPTGKITTDEATWTAALKSLGFLLSCSVFGYVGTKFGRKWPLIILAIPLIVREHLHFCSFKRLIFISFLDDLATHIIRTEHLLYLRCEIYSRYTFQFCLKSFEIIHLIWFFFFKGIITAGIFSLTQFFFVEISNDRVRGLVSSTVLNTSSLGTLIGNARIYLS